MMIDCFHEWHFLTTACPSCLNQIHPRLKWLYGPVVTRSICQGFILIWLRSLLFLDRCMVLFSFYVEVFVENACVCIRLIGPTYVVVLFIWLFAVFTVMLLGWSSRLSMWIKLILSYLILIFLPIERPWGFLVLVLVVILTIVRRCTYCHILQMKCRQKIPKYRLFSTAYSQLVTRPTRHKVNS